MANKKRYYKNRSPKQNAQNQESVNQQTARFSQEQLALSTEDLGISESTRELLLKNRIQTAADLVKRTEKDMYKVQGLNKKILFEIKDALKAKDMRLRPEPVKETTKQDNQNASQNEQRKGADAQSSDSKRQNDKKQPSSKERGETVERRNDKSTGADRQERSKFGLSDRASAKPQNKQSANQKQSDKKPQKTVEKLTEPLKPGQWRKVLKGGKWGYSNGFKIVIPTMYDEIFAFKEGLASVEIDEKCGYIDEENNVVIPLDYDTAMSFSEGLAMVCKGEKCGYINKNDEVVIPFEYDAGTPFENGEAKIKKDGKWGTITTDGKITWI